jgi:hypothetical protein
MPNLPDPTLAAHAAARATVASIGPDLDAQSVGHWAASHARSWLAGNGVTPQQFAALSDQHPISTAYSRFVTAFRAEYARLVHH